MRTGENIYKRKDGRWEGRFAKGRNEQGHIIYGSVYGRRYKEVKEKLVLRKLAYATASGQRKTYNGTVAEYMNQWLEHTHRQTIKATTYSNYRGKVDNHIFPYLGDEKLRHLNHEMIRAFIQHLEEKKLSNGVIQNTVHLLKKMFQHAIKEGELHQDPCQHIRLPTVRKPAIPALSMEDQKKLERSAHTTPHGLSVIIALYTGMRIGEISGLQWSDIDWKGNKIHVERTVSRISSVTQVGKTELWIDLPKTHTSFRKIPLASNLKKYLQLEKKRSNSTYVISCKGHVTEPRIITYRFKRLLTQAGLPSICFHSLRHTFATRCLEQGADIATISKILGHSSVKMTLDTYTDSLWESRASVLTKLDRRLNV